MNNTDGPDVDPEVLDPDDDTEATTPTDACTVCASVTPEEAEEGQRMGTTTDTGDHTGDL